MKLTPKLTLLFVFFAAALLSVVNLLGYNVGRRMLEEAAVAELESIAGEKQAAMNAWLDEKRGDIKALAEDPATVEETFVLKTTSLDYRLASLTHNRLVREFQLRVSAGEFLSVMLLDSKSGKIMVSTDPQEENRPKDARSFFPDGKQGTYITPIYYSQALQAPAITASAPVISEDGQLLAILVGRVDLDELNAIIQRRSGTRQTDEAFLVNALHQPVTQPRFLPDPAVLQHGIYTTAINNCLDGKSGSAFANDYQSIPVIVVYRSLLNHQICMIVKISQAEILAQEHSFAITNILISLAALLIASLVALALSRTILRPIVAMQNAAQRYGQGDLSVRLPETRQDELGSLAREFNVMAGSLADKELELRSYAETLERKVEERTSALREREEMFKYIFDHSVIGKSITQLDGTMTVNQAFCEFLGYSEEELVKKNWEELTYPDDIEPSRQAIATLLAGEKDWVRLIKRYLHKDGSVVWADLGTGLRRDQNGKPLYFVTDVLDITERKQAEMKLADALEFTERILTSAPVGIFTYRLNGQCLSANAAAAQMVGATIEQLKSQNFHELESWKRSGLYDLAKQAIATKQLTADDVHVHTTFGKEAWYRAQFVTFHSGGEELLLMIFNDITERKKAEEAVVSGRRRFQALIEHAPDGIALLELDGKLRQVTPSTLQILGYIPEDAQGQDPALLTHPDDLPGLLGVLNDLIENPGKVVRTEYRFQHKDGSWRWLESTISNLIAEPGVDAIVFNYRDVTERKQVQEALRDSETRYRTLMERSLEAIYIFEADTKRVILANPAFLNLLGYTAEEVKTLTLYDIVGHDPNSIDLFLGQVLSEGGLSMGEQFWRCKDGTMSPVEVTANRIRQGEKDLIFVVGRDMAERKQAEIAIREKERLLSESQRVGQVGSLSFDMLNNTFHFSDEVYHLLDISPEKFRDNSKDFLALVYPSDRSNVANWLADLRAGLQIKELDFRIFKQNGELRHLRCKGAIEFNSDGQPNHFIGTLQDITAQRIAEIQINQQLKRLTALSEIDRAIISGLDQQHVLGVILSAAITQLQVDAADILLLDSDGQVLQYAAGQGFHAQTVKEMRMRLGEGYSGRAVRDRRMIRIPDLAERTHDAAFNDLVTAEKFASYTAVPLIVKREVKGVLEVFHRTFFRPDQEWLDFLNTLAGQTAIALENATLLGNLQASNQELAQAYDATLEGWSHAMDLRDKETEGHTQRVTELTLKVARAFGMSESQLVQIRRGALLHDIGKLGVPDHILFKPDKLTPEEWEIMQKHPEYAYEMLSSIQYLKPALAIPYFHHEKWDGSGYPLGLRGEQIPLEARIFSVIDVWDALLSDRPYRKAWTVERTLEYIQTLAGSHFDPNVVESFMKIMKS